MLLVLIAMMGFFYMVSNNVMPSVSGNFLAFMLLAFLALIAFVFMGVGGRARVGF
jgi:hypothetical protein